MEKTILEEKKLEGLLLKTGKITLDRLNEIKEEQKKSSVSLEQILKDKKIISDKDLVKFYGASIGVPFVELGKKILSKELLYKLPEKIARKYQAIIFGEKDEKLQIAMVDPEDFQAIEFIQKRCNQELEVFIATPEEIYSALNLYSGLEVEIEKTIAEGTGEFVIPEIEELEGPQKIEDIIKQDAPISRLVSTLVQHAVREKASDIHIEPGEKKINVRYRIDGILKRKLILPKQILSAVVSRIKIISNLKIDETRLPQDGRFHAVIDRKEIDFRVSTLPTVNGEKVVMRVLDTSSGIMTLEQLGLSGKGFKIINKNVKKPHGMILVTGPTGSGKSTTLYAILDILNEEGVNIITVEDPVEYYIENINQSQVHQAIGYTFANGLRTILRQDPDIIMVGEIRDKETAEMAVHAALTGHIVLSTLHTNSASGAIPRLIDMGIEPFLIASSVTTLVAQRLVRKICEDCREKYSLPSEVVKEIEDEIAKMPQDIQKNIQIDDHLQLTRGKGCQNCNNTGYRGRVGIFEVIPMDEKIEELTLRRAPDSDIAQAAIEEGMTTMKQDGILKVLDGITTMEEVWRVTRE